MKTQQYRAIIRDERGAIFPVIVVAESQAQAKQQVVGQYGAKNISCPPMPI